MKKRMAKALIWVANKLHPLNVDVFAEKTVFEPKVCASGYEISKGYIRKIKKAEHLSSTKKAVALAIERELIHAKEDVFRAIDGYILQQKVYKKGDAYIVEVRVNCYVPKEA